MEKSEIKKTERCSENKDTESATERVPQDNSFLKLSQMDDYLGFVVNRNSLLVELREQSIRRGDWTADDEIWWQKAMIKARKARGRQSHQTSKDLRDKAKMRRMADKQRKKAEDLGMEYGDYLQIMKGWKKNEESTQVCGSDTRDD